MLGEMISPGGVMKTPRRPVGMTPGSNSMHHGATLSKGNGWFCRRADCDMAVKKKLNFGINCSGCCRHKGAAISPPDFALVGWAKKGAARWENGQGAAAAAAASRSRKGKRVSWADRSSSAPTENATEPPQVASAKEPTNETKKSAWANVELQDQEKSLIADVLPAIGNIIKSLAAERAPMASDAMPDATAVFAKLCDPLTPCASIAKMQELDKEKEALTAARHSLDPDRDQALVKSIDERLAAAKEAKEKLQKKTPTSAALASALREAQSKFERSIQDRLDRQAAGVTRAHERKQARRQELAKLRTQLDALEGLLEGKEQQAAKAFADKNAAQESLEQTVLAMFQTKLAEQAATAQQAATTDAIMASPDSAAVPNSSQKNDPSNFCRPLAEDLSEQLARAKAELDASLQQLQLQKARIAADTAFNVTVDVTQPTARTIEVDNEFRKEAAIMWHHWLHHWTLAGGIDHFSISSVASHAKEAHAGNFIAQMFADLVGTDVWNSWVPNGGSKEEAIIPRQLAWLAQATLQRTEVDFRQKESIKAAASDSYTLCTAQNKKRRAQLPEL